MATIAASENVFPTVRLAEGAAPSTPPTGEVHLYAKADGLLYWKDDAGTEYPASQAAALAAHLADASDAHDASAISVLDIAGDFTATDVEAALAELFAAIGGGGISATTVDAKGDLIVGTADDTVDNLTVGANDLSLVAASGTATGLKWGRPVGTILAAICYGNSTDTKTTSSTSLADADATNLAVAFDAPASGIVLVRLTGVCSPATTGGGAIGDQYIWGVRESSSTVAGPSTVVRMTAAPATVNEFGAHTMAYKITGLTPGSSHTYKWAHQVTNASQVAALVTSAASPATMEVIAL